MLAIRRSLVLAFALLGVVGCGISPQPTPPGADPEIDAAALTMTTSGDSVEIIGGRGAVLPADGTVRAYNLDDATSQVDGAVASDGSFVLTLIGDLAQDYRLQARIDDARSLPLDVTGTVDAAPVALVPVPSGDCLSSVPELELDFGSVALGAPISIATVTYDNGCAVPIVLAAATLRAGGVGAFQIMQPAQFPKTIATGAQDVAEIGFKAPATGSFEEILFVALETADGPRRIVTVRGDIVP
jgi:hypothetical protein